MGRLVQADQEGLGGLGPRTLATPGVLRSQVVRSDPDHLLILEHRRILLVLEVQGFLETHCLLLVRVPLLRLLDRVGPAVLVGHIQFHPFVLGNRVGPEDHPDRVFQRCPVDQLGQVGLGNL